MAADEAKSTESIVYDALSKQIGAVGTSVDKDMKSMLLLMTERFTSSDKRVDEMKALLENGVVLRGEYDQQQKAQDAAIENARREAATEAGHIKDDVDGLATNMRTAEQERSANRRILIGAGIGGAISIGLWVLNLLNGQVGA